MPPFINLIALTSLVIIALSSAPVQVNALAADRAQVARHVHGHDAIAKRKRSDTTSRCNPRPSSSLTSSTPPPPTYTTPSSTYTPPSSPTSTAPPATTSTPPTQTSDCGSKKWGLAWGADPSFLPNFNLNKVGLLYDWDVTLPSNIPSGIRGIPMAWGWDKVADWNSTVIPGYSTIAFSANEPNEPSQSNMDAASAVEFWLEYMEPLHSEGYTLISPACTNDDSGLQWYSQFFPACYAAGCHIDGIAFHAYVTDAQAVIDYANTLHTTYNLPVWITEFADQNFSGQGGQATMDQIWDYAGQIVDFVDNTSWICGAFPFGIMDDLQGVNTLNSLLQTNGYPTDLAYYYLGQPN